MYLLAAPLQRNLTKASDVHAPHPSLLSRGIVDALRRASHPKPSLAWSCLEHLQLHSTKNRAARRGICSFRMAYVDPHAATRFPGSNQVASDLQGALNLDVCGDAVVK